MDRQPLTIALTLIAALSGCGESDDASSDASTTTDTASADTSIADTTSEDTTSEDTAVDAPPVSACELPEAFTQGTSEACSADILSSLEEHAIDAAASALALPPSFTVEEHTAARAASFEDVALGLYGFIVEVDASSNDPNVVNGPTLGRIAQGAATFQNLDSGAFLTWSHPTLLSRTAVRNDLSFTFGEGSPNGAAVDPVTLRDAMLSAVSQTEITSSASPTAACNQHLAFWSLVLRDDSTAVATMLLGCGDTAGLDEPIVRDVQSAALLAPTGYTTCGLQCVSGDGGEIPIDVFPLPPSLRVSGEVGLLSRGEDFTYDSSRKAITVTPAETGLSIAYQYWIPASE